MASRDANASVPLSARTVVHNSGERVAFAHRLGREGCGRRADPSETMRQTGYRKGRNLSLIRDRDLDAVVIVIVGETFVVA